MFTYEYAYADTIFRFWFCVFDVAIFGRFAASALRFSCRRVWFLCKNTNINYVILGYLLWRSSPLIHSGFLVCCCRRRQYKSINLLYCMHQMCGITGRVQARASNTCKLNGGCSVHDMRFDPIFVSAEVQNALSEKGKNRIVPQPVRFFFSSSASSENVE